MKITFDPENHYTMENFFHLLRKVDNQRREINQMACQVKDLKRIITRVCTKRKTVSSYIRDLEGALRLLSQHVANESLSPEGLTDDEKNLITRMAKIVNAPEYKLWEEQR